MNSKLIKASLAGAAALAVAASGTTFAAWSDFRTSSSDVSADKLVLDIGDPATTGFHQMKMAPGVNREFDFVVASRPGSEVVPAASLNVQLLNLDDSGDIVDSNSEDLAEAGPGVSPAGELDDEAMININASLPTTDVANACSGAHARGSRQTSISLRSLATNTALITNAVNLLTAGDIVQPGEAVCVAMGLSLPTATSTDASQGDAVSFDLQFNLKQITSGYTDRAGVVHAPNAY